VTELNMQFADLLPPLSTDEFHALEADIQANGVQMPIVIDEDSNILDGHHRYKIDPDAPTKIITGLTIAEKMAYVLRSNLTRRNLSVEQKKELRDKMQEVAYDLRELGFTQGAIGDLLGVSESTVSRWLDATILHMQDGCIDSRVVIPKAADPVILERLDAGETQVQVAADYGVTQGTIAKRAKKAREKQEKQQAATVPESPETITDPTFTVKRGDIWRLGNHRVMCGDAYNQNDLGTLTDGYTVDALITDPPYGIAYKPNWNKWDGSPSDFEEVIGDDQVFDPSPFLSFSTVVMFGANYFSNRLPIGGWVCWDKRLDVSKDGMFGSPFELAWYRSINTTRKSVMIRVLHGGVVNADSTNGNNEKRLHPTQKPVEVMKQIMDVVTKPGNVILDPFAGSGATLLACADKTCLAMEIDIGYVAVILQRWSNNTGLTPELIGENNGRD